MIEVLEPRRVMSAVSAVDDSFVLQPTETPSPVVLDVLSNDLSALGNLSFSAVGSVLHGSVATQSADPYGSGESSTPTLIYTPEANYEGTELFTYGPSHKKCPIGIA